jgi:hypothetical protein
MTPQAETIPLYYVARQGSILICVCAKCLKLKKELVKVIDKKVTVRAHNWFWAGRLELHWPVSPRVGFRVLIRGRLSKQWLAFFSRLDGQHENWPSVWSLSRGLAWQNSIFAQCWHLRLSISLSLSRKGFTFIDISPNLTHTAVMVLVSNTENIRTITIWKTLVTKM